MSNTVDIFLPRKDCLAVPAGNPVVFLEGEMCPFLQVVEITRASNPGYGTATLAYNPAVSDSPEVISPEQALAAVGMCSRVSIRQFYNSGTGSSIPDAIVLFSGHVENVLRKVDSKGETIEFTARDLSGRFERITIYGRRVVDSTTTAIFLEDSKTVFNENNKADCCGDTVSNNCSTYYVFSSNEQNAQYWTYARAVRYLLCEHLCFGLLQIPDLVQLEAVFGHVICDELDVTGLSLLKAIEKCSLRAGVKFRFAPSQYPTGPEQEIVFYKPGRGRAVQLSCQYPGEQLSLSQTNICAVGERCNYWPVTHRYIGYGDYRIYEASFNLIKAWDPASEGSQRTDYSVDAEGFEQVRDVYRKWCLNEAGDYTDAPFNQGGEYDFSMVFQSDKYLRRRRKFLKTLSTDLTGESVGFYLEHSYDGGQSWNQFTDNFDVLDSECGVWLDMDEISEEFWIAATGGLLRFRITAAVADDSKVGYSIAKGAVNSVAQVVDHIIEQPARFKFRKVSPKSIFYKSSDFAIGVPDEADDTTALAEYLRRVAGTEYSLIATLDVKTPVLETNFEPGDRIECGPESRDMLGVRADSRSLFWVETVRMDFQNQCSFLRILRSRDIFYGI